MIEGFIQIFHALLGFVYPDKSNFHRVFVKFEETLCYIPLAGYRPSEKMCSFFNDCHTIPHSGFCITNFTSLFTKIQPSYTPPCPLCKEVM